MPKAPRKRGTLPSTSPGTATPRRTPKRSMTLVSQPLTIPLASQPASLQTSTTRGSNSERTFRASLQAELTNNLLKDHAKLLDDSILSMRDTCQSLTGNFKDSFAGFATKQSMHTRIMRHWTKSFAPEPFPNEGFPTVRLQLKLRTDVNSGGYPQFSLRVNEEFSERWLELPILSTFDPVSKWNFTIQEGSISCGQPSQPITVASLQQYQYVGEGSAGGEDSPFFSDDGYYDSPATFG